MAQHRRRPRTIMPGLKPVVLAALLLTAAGCRNGSTPDPDSAPDEVRFDWFEYTGRDPVFDALPTGPDQYVNPVMAGFYPDPSIVRVDEDYYMVHSTFSYFPGIPVFHSRNLVDWTQVGNVLDRPEQMNLDSLGVSRGVFAPTIRHHEGTFYVVNTLVDAGGNFVVTAADPAGPWSDPVWLPEVDGIDPSLFFDTDGRAYVTNNGPPAGPPLYEGHRALWIQEFDPAALRTAGPRTMIVDGGVDISRQPIWIEGPHIFRVDPYYVLIAAEGGTGTMHSEVVFRSRDLRGPWVPYEGNPILTQRHLDPARYNPVTSTGHADMVQTPDGDWWAVFLGCRPYGPDHYNTGRETFLLPVRWQDGWPVILDVDQAVPMVAERPALPSDAPPAIPHRGNFTVRDDFDGDAPHPYWLQLRTPREAWYHTEAGALVLEARPDSLGGLGQPSFLARRQQHMHATVTTSMRPQPSGEGSKAGIAAFQNEAAWYLVAVADGEDGPEIRLEQGGPGGTLVLAAATVALSDLDPVGLRIDADADRYTFSYALPGADWTTLAEDVDGTVLSTARAGGFVGTVFGLYAHSPRK
jgi:alpha-N-arabinofuranosidase